MAKRASGPPRRPRNPVAKAVRTPAFRQRVVPDKRWKESLRQSDREADQPTGDEPDKDKE